jgi:branched-chain amino acid transport system permease protein
VVTPIQLREHSPAHRAYLTTAWLLAIIPLAYIPFAADIGFTPASITSAIRIGQLNNTIAYAVAILGLNIVTGYSGQLVLGQSAFIGLGAYTTVILVADHHWSYYATIPATIAICFTAGLIVGIPATRVRGVYLAIITLVLAYVFPALILRFGWLTGGPNGKGPGRSAGKLLPPHWLPFANNGRTAGPLWVYCLSLLLAATLFLLARNTIHTRPGRAIITIRDHQPSAVAYGVNVPLYKVVAFGLSAVCGGLAGTMLMMNRPFATDAQFDIQLSLFLFAGLVIGGTGTISGAIPGALAYMFVPYYLRVWTFDQSGIPPGLRQLTAPLFALLRPAGGDAAGILFGLGLILLMFVLPGGLVDGVRRIRDRIVTVVPDPAWRTGDRRRPPSLGGRTGAPASAAHVASTDSVAPEPAAG